MGEGHFGAAVSAPPTRRCRFGAGQFGAVPFRRRKFGRRFLLLFYFSSYEEKSIKAGNSLNAVERKPIPTRVLNPKASEACYKPKKRSY